jgi:hypothetical protein
VQTLEQLVGSFGIDVDQHLDREDIVPVVNGLQRQGDVIVIPTPDVEVRDGKQVPAQGVAVVRGENGGNTHLLLASGDVKYAVVESDRLDIGTFTVAEGATAYLAHPEHGYAGIAPGTYTVRRQREQADEIRMVAD